MSEDKSIVLDMLDIDFYLRRIQKAKAYIKRENILAAMKELDATENSLERLKFKKFFDEQ